MENIQKFLYANTKEIGMKAARGDSLCNQILDTHTSYCKDPNNIKIENELKELVAIYIGMIKV